MDQPTIPRRSALYMPASNARAIAKSRELPVDVVILDLEDSVAPSQKESARRQAVEAVTSGGFGSREVVIRINGFDTPWHVDDLQAAVRAAPHGILVPKVESPESILGVAQLMESLNTPSHTKLWCMLETPRGVLAANEILRSHPKLSVAVMGTSDLTTDLRARHTSLRLPLLTSLGLCLLAARAYGVTLLDGVFLDLDDAAGFEKACAQSRELGFDGKTLIHPRQIMACNLAFSPTTAEVEMAQATVAAFTKAQEQGAGVTVVGGRLVEALHVSEAKRILGLHQSLTQPQIGLASRSGIP
jgi:citrate lyase subunit beta/citryl-CoA lyase